MAFSALSSGTWCSSVEFENFNNFNTHFVVKNNRIPTHNSNINTKLALHTRTQVLRQGDKDVNFDDSKSGYYYLYNRTISVIKYINDFLEEAVVFYEKFKNLLNWTHPRKTQVRHFLSLKKIKIQALL